MTIGIGSHGLPCCPHLITGYRNTGSADTRIEGRGASRATVDTAMHNCPHCGVNLCIQGSPDVFINGYPAHRALDQVTEYCGTGITIVGSSTVSANGGFK